MVFEGAVSVMHGTEGGGECLGKVPDRGHMKHKVCVISRGVQLLAVIMEPQMNYCNELSLTFRNYL